jgi:hypothetical protein
MDRHLEGMAVGEVDQVQGDTDTATLSARASAVRVLLLQCQPIMGACGLFPAQKKLALFHAMSSL